MFVVCSMKFCTNLMNKQRSGNEAKYELSASKEKLGWTYEQGHYKM